MKSLTDCFTLSNGVKIPCIGFGTWKAPSGDITKNAVKAALDAGYRHIDAAQAYANEDSVGQGIKESGVAREDIFITSKLFNPFHSYEKTKDAFEKTMKDLGLDYLDLYLIHWPNPISIRDHWEEGNAETWRAFEEYYAEGRIRAIGVSNFHPHHLKALEKTAKIAPMVNQIRLCPGDTKVEIVSYSKGKNMLIEAYSPLGGSGPENLISAPLLVSLSEKYNKTPAQICVRWCMQCGYLPLPKSVSPTRIFENVQVFDFELDSADVDKLSALQGYPDPFPHPDEITW